MALNWYWSDKCGEAVIRDDSHDMEYTYTLYEGNAFLIILYEYKDENGTDMYNVHGFFSDKQHAKNCLGLNKKDGYTDNIYNREYARLTKIRLNKAKYRYTKDLVAMLVQAFDNIDIEIFSEEE